MLLEYFQMIDRVETLDLEGKTLTARSIVPAKSPVFEGHFPGMPLVPGVLLIETMAQASGIRVLSFRHEQNAGYAASIAGFLTKQPGVCVTVSAPGFLNGLTALAHATTNCFPMILISGSSEREIVDLQQGDYEEMDQLAIAKPLCKAAYRVLHAQDIGIGFAPRQERHGRALGVHQVARHLDIDRQRELARAAQGAGDLGGRAERQFHFVVF